MSRSKIGHLKRRRQDSDSADQQSLRRGLTGEIAYRAARLIAEDGMSDFGAAKQKAARQLGVKAQSLLPDNLVLDAALRSHQSIFQGNSQPVECDVLRQIAADVMRWLDHFSPWLFGAVLSGSANRFSRVELEIVADDTKQLEIFFLNEGVKFETRSSRVYRMQANATGNEVSIYEISFQEFPVVIVSYPHHARRVARQRHEGPDRPRAKLSDVEALIAR